MSIVKKLLIALVALVALLVLVGLFLPSSAHVERATAIAAPAHVVFALVDDLSNFNRWSPWADRDPETVYAFEGPRAGVGAQMTWASENPQVGSGSQRITLSEADRRVETLLDFGSQGTAEAFFELQPTDDGTVVTWGFDTDFGLDLMDRYLGLMFDSWIGADYEEGLGNLKELAESLPAADWRDLEIEVVEVDPAVIVYKQGSTDWDVAEIGQALEEAYGEIGKFMRRNKLEIGGAPLATTLEHDGETWTFEAGIPIAVMPELEIAPDSPIQIRRTEGGKTLRAVSVGPYNLLSTNWEKLLAFATIHGFEQSGPVWEQYVSDPGDTPEAELVTHLNMPVQ